MMEPVAWLYCSGLNEGPWLVTVDQRLANAEQQMGNSVLPLVRLSDAEARIAEWERQWQMERDLKLEYVAAMKAAEARAEAAEALLKEQKAKIDRLMLFGGRMANACYNIGQKPKPSHMDMVDLLFAQAEWDKAVRAARACGNNVDKP